MLVTFTVHYFDYLLSIGDFYAHEINNIVVSLLTV